MIGGAYNHSLRHEVPNAFSFLGVHICLHRCCNITTNFMYDCGDLYVHTYILPLALGKVMALIRNLAAYEKFSRIATK
jgi:hypothetical protein